MKIYLFDIQKRHYHQKSTNRDVCIFTSVFHSLEFPHGYSKSSHQHPHLLFSPNTQSKDKKSDDSFLHFIIKTFQSRKYLMEVKFFFLLSFSILLFCIKLLLLLLLLTSLHTLCIVVVIIPKMKIPNII